MKDKMYYIIDEDTQEIEYVIVAPGSEDVYTLKRSASKRWADHVRGQEVLTVFNTGDGFVIKWVEKQKKLMQYDCAAELMIMLNFMNRISHIPLNYKLLDASDAPTVS